MEKQALDWYNEGLEFLEDEDYENAVISFSEAINIDSNNYEFYSNRGLAYCYLDKIDAGIEDYNKAVELNPNVDSVYFDRGVAYFMAEQFDKAIADFYKVLEFTPDNDYITAILALHTMVWSNMKKLLKAIQKQSNLFLIIQVHIAEWHIHTIN